MPIDQRPLLKKLDRLAIQPLTKEDWLDLYQTLDAYQRRCLARAIARSPERDDLVAAIKQLAEEGD